MGSVPAVVISVTSAILGVFFLSVALSGYLFEPISLMRRALICVGALATLMPFKSGHWDLLFLNIAGFLFSMAAMWPEGKIFWHRIAGPRSALRKMNPKGEVLTGDP